MKVLLFMILCGSILSNQNEYKKHHHHHRKNEFTVSNTGDNWSNDENIAGKAGARSEGNGSSSALTGRKGSQSEANGTKGSSSFTDFKNDRKSVRNNWETYEDSNGKSNQVSDNWVDNEKNSNHADAIAKGKGNTKTLSNTETSAAFGEGSKGTKVDSEYRNERHNARDAFQKFKDGDKELNIRDNTSYDGRIITEGSGMGIGNGKALTNSNHDGSAVQAKGDCESEGTTMHKADEKKAQDNWMTGREGGHKFAVENNWSDDNKTNGASKSEAHGKGGLKTFTDRENGSGGNAQGTKGTNNKVIYNRDENNVSNNWKSDKWNRAPRRGRKYRKERKEDDDEEEEKKPKILKPTKKPYEVGAEAEAEDEE